MNPYMDEELAGKGWKKGVLDRSGLLNSLRIKSNLHNQNRHRPPCSTNWLEFGWFFMGWTVLVGL